MAKVRVTRNYQVTIPQEVRTKLGIQEGDVIELEAVDQQRAVLRRIIPVELLEGAWDEEMDRAMAEVRRLWKGWKLPKTCA